jgi:menaquinol-cytochrome c reductase iron-sulfur subunit
VVEHELRIIRTEEETNTLEANCMIDRRDFYRYATLSIGTLIGLVLAVPGAAYVLDPLRRKNKFGGFREVARLSHLPVGVPKAFPVVEERQDAWVKYPPEPIGSVWLIRQKEGSTEPVVAFTAECPHLGCPVGLASDGKSFFCPCHTSAFNFDGSPLNQVPPRGMDRLDVELSKDIDPAVRVKFERFRAQAEEKIPIV